jgi:hypothetical protein
VSAVEELLRRKNGGSGLENRKYIRRGSVTWHTLSAEVDSSLADKRRALGRYSSLADSDHGVFLCLPQDSRFTGTVLWGFLVTSISEKDNEIMIMSSVSSEELVLCLVSGLCPDSGRLHSAV